MLEGLVAVNAAGHVGGVFPRLAMAAGAAHQAVAVHTVAVAAALPLPVTGRVGALPTCFRAFCSDEEPS